MNKFFKINYLFVVILSFFLYNFSVNAVEQKAVNTLPYYNFLNFYNLQYSKNPISNKFYNYLDSINFNIYELLYNEDPIISFSTNFNTFSTRSIISNSDYLISFDCGYISNSDSIDYLFSSNSLCFNLYTFPDNISQNLEYSDSQYSLLFKGKNISKFSYSIHYNSSTDTFDLSYSKDTYQDFNNLTFSLGSSSSISQFFGAYYQSSFGPIGFDSDTLQTPVGVSSILINGRYYTSSDYKYLGYDFFDNNLVFGSGQPLYPAYSYFTNDFPYGPPYTEDFNKSYLYGNYVMVLKPTSALLNDFDNIHSLGLDKIYFKYTDPLLSSSSDFIYSVVYNDAQGLANSFDTKECSNCKKYNPYSLGNDFLKLSLDINSIDNYILFRLSNNFLRAGNSMIIYYPNKYFTLSTSLVVNSSNMTIKDEFGNDLDISVGDFIDSDVPWYQSIFDSLGSFLSFLLEIFANLSRLFKSLYSSISDLFVYIGDSFSILSGFNQFFIFIGSTISLFFNSMPILVQNSLFVIFIITGLIIVFKLIFR